MTVKVNLATATKSNFVGGLLVHAMAASVYIYTTIPHPWENLITPITGIKNISAHSSVGFCHLTDLQLLNQIK